MDKTIARHTPIRLHVRDGEIMVTPQDQDIFFINAEKATQACRNEICHEERVARFTDGLLRPLAEWCEERKQRISACYVAWPESSVLPVYVVGATERYDFDLTKQLSELAFWFEEQGWSVQASQIPRCAAEQLCGYFNPGNALQIHG